MGNVTCYDHLSDSVCVCSFVATSEIWKSRPFSDRFFLYS